MEQKKSIKILYVLVLTVTVVAFIGLRKYSEFNREHHLKPAKAKNDMLLIMSALISYQKEFNTYPAAHNYDKFLKWEADPTYKTEIPVTDPWGTPYKYESPGPDNLPYRIISLGADKASGGIGKDSDLFSDEMLKKLIEDLQRERKKVKH